MKIICHWIYFNFGNYLMSSWIYYKIFVILEHVSSLNNENVSSHVITNMYWFYVILGHVSTFSNESKKSETWFLNSEEILDKN